MARELLWLLAKADALGRICADQRELLEKIELCGALAEEDCLTGPRVFPSRHRIAAVPEGAILRMLSKLVPPKRFEARQVDWF